MAYEWVDRVILINIEIYKQEPLVAKYFNAMTVVSDLRALDTEHDKIVATMLIEGQQHFAPQLDPEQARGNAMTMVQMIHGVLSNAVWQETKMKSKMHSDLRFCLAALVAKYLT